MDIAQRLELFFRRLAEAPPAASAEEALALVCRLMEEVEEEFCPLAKQTPAPKRFTGRMYPPQADRIYPAPDGSIEADTRRHQIHCAPDGRIAIYRKESTTPVLNKPGRQ